MEYILIYSQRKTLAIDVTREGILEVRAPLWLSRTDLNEILAENFPWIQSQLALRQELLAQKAAFFLEEGTLLPLLGKEYPILTGGGPAWEGEAIRLPGVNLRREAEAFYRMEAQRILSEKVALWGSTIGLCPERISITGAKARWGSCSSKGTLCFSWRLIRAPEEAVDYVVIHELIHLAHLNHSQKFWKDLEHIVPDWEHRRSLLSLVQRRLEAEGWND